MEFGIAVWSFMVALLTGAIGSMIIFGYDWRKPLLKMIVPFLIMSLGGAPSYNSVPFLIRMIIIWTLWFLILKFTLKTNWWNCAKLIAAFLIITLIPDYIAEYAVTTCLNTVK